MTTPDIQAVLDGRASWAITAQDVLLFYRSLPTDSVWLTFGSPPYPEKGERYGANPGNRKWPMEEWVEWMMAVTHEAVRVSQGDVLWVVNGSVKEGCYHPACEGLVWEWHKQGGICDRSCIWEKNAPPNRKNWYGNNWEFVLCFRKDAKRTYFNWEAVALPPKYKAGGRFRQRDSKGQRRLGNEYPQNKLARPRDLVRVTVGGGHMGSKSACQNEAPYPEKLVEYFVPVLAPPNEIVCDPFSGSGTTAAVALKHGRRFIGADLRQDQVDLTTARIAEAIREAA